MKRKDVMVILGASGRIGQAIALALAGRNSRIGLHYFQNRPKAERTAQHIVKLGGQGLALAADLRDRNQFASVLDGVMDRWKRIDLLIHCAGITRDGTINRSRNEDWDEVIQVNLSSPFFGLSYISEKMKRGSGGQVILFGSAAGMHGRPGQSNYSASKAGLVGLMRCAAIELAPWNIRVNLVLPGYHSSGISKGLSNKATQSLMNQNILGRFSSIDEVTGFIRWLSKTQNISGQIFNLDSRIL